MKILPFIISILSAVMICGCRRECDPKLSHLDSALWQNPDSVYFALQEIDTTSLDKHDRAFRRLLMAESADKSDRTDTSAATLSFLQDYYLDGNRDLDLHTRVNYILGRIHIERKEKAKGLEYFRKTLRNTDEKSNYKLLARACAQISGIYIDSKLYRHAKVFTREQQKFGELIHDTAIIINSTLWLATECMYLQSADSARLLYEELSPVVKKYGNSHYSSLYLAQIANYLIDTGEFAKADSLIKNGGIVVDEELQSSVESIKNKLDLHFGRTENVAHTSLDLLQTSHDLYAKKTAARNLALINLRKGNVADAFKYTDSFYHLWDSISKAEAQENVVELEKLYSFSEAEKERYELEKENISLSYHRKGLIGIIIAAILIGIIIGTHVKRKFAEKKAKARKEIDEMKNTIGDHEKTISQLNQNKKSLEKIIEDHDKTIKLKNTEIAERNRDIKEKEREIDNLEKLKKNADDIVEEKEAFLNSLKSDLDQKENRIVGLESEARELREQINNKNEQLNEKQRIENQLRNEMDLMKEESDRKSKLISDNTHGYDDEKIAMEIRKSLGDDPDRKKSFVKLKIYIESTYPDFSFAIHRLSLKEYSLIDAMLIKIGFSISECAHALKTDYYNVTNRRKRLAEKFGIKKRGFHSWQEFVLSIRENDCT